MTDVKTLIEIDAGDAPDGWMYIWLIGEGGDPDSQWKIPAAMLIGGGYTDAQARAAVSVAPTGIAGTDHTLTLANAHSYLRFTNEAGCAITVPLEASVAYVMGTVITMRAQTAGAVTIEGDTGVTLNPVGGAPGEGPFAFAEIGAVVQIKKVGADEWDVIGGLAVV
jgi:hypothetical protein